MSAGMVAVRSTATVVSAEAGTGVPLGDPDLGQAGTWRRQPDSNLRKGSYGARSSPWRRPRRYARPRSMSAAKLASSPARTTERSRSTA